MQKIMISKVSAVVIALVLACGCLGFISSARSQTEASRFSWPNTPNPPRCSDRTIAGSYAFTIEGTLLIAPGVTLPIRGISLANYDGKGNMTQVDHVVDNGVPPQLEWTPGSGTYTVNPDCTGSQVIVVPGSPSSPVNLHFVIDQGGRQIRQVVDAGAVTAIGSRVD
jgi:hypothetical protein